MEYNALEGFTSESTRDETMGGGSGGPNIYFVILKHDVGREGRYDITYLCARGGQTGLVLSSSLPEFCSAPPRHLRQLPRPTPSRSLPCSWPLLLSSPLPAAFRGYLEGHCHFRRRKDERRWTFLYRLPLILQAVAGQRRTLAL